jgi:hypothetical protein
LHANEQRFTLLLTPNRWETCWTANFIQIALEETLCIRVQRQAASLSSFATADGYRASCKVNIAHLDIADFLNPESSVDQKC